MGQTKTPAPAPPQQPQPPLRPGSRWAGIRRRGVACVLAMLYLVIFASIALGFYAQVTISAQVSGNERRAAEALAAAESGMAFMRYQLSRVQAKHTPESQLLAELSSELARLMQNSGNLTAIGTQQVGLSSAGDAVVLPLNTGAYVALGNGTGFRCRITRTGRSLLVKVAGRSGNIVKGVEYAFEPRQLPVPLFDYGIAGRGQVEVGGGGQILGGSNPAYGSVLSTGNVNPAVNMTGNGVISGKVYLKNPAATYSYASGASVNGSTDAAWKIASTIYLSTPPQYAHLAEWPEFPRVDTDAYKAYATNVCVSPVGTTFKNIRIPAGSGTASSPFTFGSGVTIEGVCFIEAPNVVWFAGGCNVRGVIVGPNAPSGTLADNVVEFRGQATMYDMCTLPATADFPAELRAMKGLSVGLPGFHVMFSGGYASVSGTIVSDQLSFTGSAGGNITGYVIGLSNQKLVVAGQGMVRMEKPPAGSPWPAGLYFRHYYVPLRSTHREFHPSLEGM